MKRIVALLLAGLLLVAGCGASFEDVARATVNTGGLTLEIVDREVAVAYTRAAAEALAASQTLPEYEERMSPWDSLVDALGGIGAVLEACEALLDATDEFLEGRFLMLLAELVEGFVDVARTMESLGVDIPQELIDFVDMAENLLGGR